ncbi:MAG: hypothetical protein QOJ39_1598 [Candidatus Eremiobacteraeota bacterium]|jgi:hypothetical protein|nr:hypothetical protein [Candidatus Eremiobacteraeota bacterium]
MNAKLLLGIIGAVVGAVLGAIAWAAITATTNFQIGYMAVGVGILAGYGMRILSGGRDRADGIAAGVVALLGCVLGNILTAVVVIAQHQHYPIVATALAVLIQPVLSFELLRDGFNVMDLLFYGIAVYAGYRTALKPPAAAPAPAHETPSGTQVSLPPEERTT